jgi:hypothetical protein
VKPDWKTASEDLPSLIRFESAIFRPQEPVFALVGTTRVKAPGKKDEKKNLVHKGETSLD